MAEPIKINSFESLWWETIAQIMDYGVDSMAKADVHIGGRRVAQIDETVFLKELYAVHPNDDFEMRLVQNMLEASPLIVVVGARGSGKTSAIRHARQVIEATETDVRVEILDLKALYDIHHFSCSDTAAAVKSYRSAIREILQSRFFPGVESRLFFAWACAGNSDHGESHPAIVTEDLQDLSQIVLGLSNAPLNETRKKRIDYLHAWFNQNAYEFASLFREHSYKLRPAHVLHAALELLPWTRIVMAYDNVDRIPARDQPLLFQIINDSHNALASSIKTVIAIRLENVNGPVPRPGAGGDFVNVILPDHERYSGILMPPGDARHVEEVLNRRNEFARSLFKQHGLEQVLNRLISMHRGIVGEFIAIKIDRLANNSLRNSVALYTGFLRFINTLGSKRYVDLRELFDTSDGQKHLRTLFFLWLFQEGHKFGGDLHDVVRLTEPRSSKEGLLAFVSIEHLLVTCILNLAAERRAEHRRPVDPPFCDVLERMQTLGFSLPEVKAAIQTLCAEPGEPPKTLELYQSEINARDLTAESEHLVRVTPLGEELVTNVCCMVGYVWGRSYVYKHGSSHGSQSYHTMPARERMVLLYDYLVNMGKQHLEMLCQVRKRYWSEFEGDWLTHYRSRFGVARTFQIERILQSAISFHGPSFPKDANPFSRLKDAYQELQRQVDLQGGVKDSDWAKLTFGREIIDGPAFKSEENVDSSGGATFNKATPKRLYYLSQ